MTAEILARALRGHKIGQSWTARCPVHDDRNPSLSIGDADGKVLVYCHAGCDQNDVIAALKERGLWGDHWHHNQRIQRKRPVKSGQAVVRDIDRSAFALSIWEAAVPASNTLIETYLTSRDLTFPPSSALRFHRGLKHPSGEIWPCIVSLVTRGSDAAPLAIHRTFLARDGAEKAPVDPAKMMLGPCARGSVRLSDSATGPLVVCEGIETGLSLLSGLLDHPAIVWAALSTSGVKALELPKIPGELIVATDGDTPGREAGNALATRATAQGWNVSLMPAPDGKDWNDVLRSREVSA